MESISRARVSRRMVAIVGLSIAVVSAVFAWQAYGGQQAQPVTGSSEQNARPVGFHGRESYSFANAETMAATADVVLIGTVVSRTDGERIMLDGVGGQAEVSPLQFVDLTIAVGESFKGKVGSTVTVRAVTLQDQPDFVPTPEYPFRPDSPFLEPGAKLVIYAKVDGSGLRLLNSQAVLRLGSRVEAVASGPLTSALAQLEPGAVSEAVRQSVEKAKAEGIPPLQSGASTP